MPYSPKWVGPECLANIACNEIPPLNTLAQDWLLHRSDSWLADHGIARLSLGPGFIPTRAVLGEYLEAQFEELLAATVKMGITVRCVGGVNVSDITPTAEGVAVVFGNDTESSEILPFDYVVVATGHLWPGDNASPRIMSSPWPISKLQTANAKKIGLIGTSLSAVDSCLSLAHVNGSFQRDFNGRLKYIPHDVAAGFKITMHSRSGFLPTLRFYFEFPQFELFSYITRTDLHRHIAQNNNRLSLDFVFEDVVKSAIRTKSPELYDVIAPMTVEAFSDFMINSRKSNEPFELLRQDYAASFASIRDRRPIYWKEILDDVTYMLNFYTRYFEAADLLRVREHLMPLISHLVAVLPQKSCEELLALHDAGCLSVEAIGQSWKASVGDGQDSIDLVYEDHFTSKTVTRVYDLLIDCRGQKGIDFKDFPFPTLVETGMVAPAKISAEMLSDTGSYQMQDILLGGVNVDEAFHPVSAGGNTVTSLFILSAPLINGIYPYHSGLPFCNEIARIAVAALEADLAVVTSRKGLLNDDYKRCFDRHAALLVPAPIIEQDEKDIRMLHDYEEKIGGYSPHTEQL
ncbi:Uncharacterized NAD(P)/FAD-binding protein YdhS [Rhizobium sp. NFACC06-2]|nr:Uncharacterized NAD(P)/FAD-binding protein YdhS [Rhizobium sp. NFACC06-2]